MKISIFGAGMAGTYLAKLLEGNCELFDISRFPRCSCAYGLIYGKAKELTSKIWIDLDEYVLSRPEEVEINGISVKNRNVVIFDKKKWLSDLWNELNVRSLGDSVFSDADLKVNSTGRYGRRFDRYLVTRQYKKKIPDLDENLYIFSNAEGYAWAFPLGDHVFHVGAGAKNTSTTLDLLQKLLSKHKIPDKSICECWGKIRYIIPSWETLFWPPDGDWVAIGEAGGFVSAFGEGNLLAMETANILYEVLDKYGFDENFIHRIKSDYGFRVIGETQWIKKQHEFVDALGKGFWNSLTKLPGILRIAKSRSVELSLTDGIKILRRITK